LSAINALLLRIKRKNTLLILIVKRKAGPGARSGTRNGGKTGADQVGGYYKGKRDSSLRSE